MGLFTIIPTFIAELSGSLSAVGAGIAIVGASIGIGAIGGRACEAIGRQPEAKGPIQTAMIISAALIEGATFFALVICLLAK
jgi:F-type H+-transporting ATPase subunit c